MRLSHAIAIALLLCAAAAIVQATQPAKPGVTLEQVALTTSDGVRLSAIVYRPAAVPRPVGLMLVHGFGANFYESYFPYLGRTAAQHGMVVLALNMRDHDTGPKIWDFADNQADIAAGVEHLHSLGAKKIVLLGQSMGTNRVLYYQAASSDPTVAATVLVSGPGNLFQWNVWQFGQKTAQETVSDALRMQAEGHDRDLMLVDLGPLGKALYTPRYLLSLRGPSAKSDPYQNIQKVKNPVLILQGKADKLIEPEIAERLHKAAVNNPNVTVQYVDGANHGFASQQPLLADRVLDWIKSVLP
ncbi:MAG: alpha/beta fold hydrolase [Acidobacteriia bacterium]|nr:alpha/beta fold hydrolase [Terriglobia bacterium]